MPDYGREPAFGTFLTPANGDPARVVELAQLSEELGLDLVTFQDHPYQPAFLDTWTLLSYVAASTIRVSLAPNVLNLPLRPPAVVARAAASLDLLSGGRLELGLGSGAFWEAIEAMGGERRQPAEAVEALTEAIEIIRAIWDPGTRGGVRVAGRHYRVVGAKRGPAPAHPIQLWLGAYQPRMLRLTGRLADGWLPSAAYLGPDGLDDANATIDRAARNAGRDPADVRRLYNVNGRFSARPEGFLTGPPDRWVADLAELVTAHGMDTVILGSDDPELITTFAEQVVPAVRLAVAERRSRGVLAYPVPSAEPEREAGQAFTLVPTPDDGSRLTVHHRWDEAGRPTGPVADPDRRYAARELEAAQQLVLIHDHLRAELEQVRDLVRQVSVGALDPSAARSRINEMTIRQNNWTVGAYCAAYCRVVTTHHSIEDRALFPRLRRADPRLAGVVDRLQAEHVVIHEVLEEVDRALVAFVAEPGHGERLRLVVDELSDTLRSHLSYEERELLEPLARLGVGI